LRQAQTFIRTADALKAKRDKAILGVLLGCGLRRRELAELELSHLQRREQHWAIVDLIGKGGHIRTVPLPDWGKEGSFVRCRGISEAHSVRTRHDLVAGGATFALTGHRIHTRTPDLIFPSTASSWKAARALLLQFIGFDSSVFHVSIWLASS
jgi:site-specific recombinase XerC